MFINKFWCCLICNLFIYIIIKCVRWVRFRIHIPKIYITDNKIKFTIQRVSIVREHNLLIALVRSWSIVIVDYISIWIYNWLGQNIDWSRIELIQLLLKLIIINIIGWITRGVLLSHIIKWTFMTGINWNLYIYPSVIHLISFVYTRSMTAVFFVYLGISHV